MKPCRISSWINTTNVKRFTHTQFPSIAFLLFGWCNKRTHRTIELFRAGHILDHPAPRSNQVPGILMDFR